MGPNGETGLRDGESLSQRSSVTISLVMVWGQSCPNSLARHSRDSGHGEGERPVYKRDGAGGGHRTIT